MTPFRPPPAPITASATSRARTAPRSVPMALVPFPSATPGDDDDPDSFDESGSKMSFLEHLDELRKRLIYIVYSLIAGCAVAYIFIGKIFDFIMKPIQAI